MIDLANQLFFKEEKMQFTNLLKQFLRTMIIAKKKKILTKILLCLKKMKKDFNQVVNAGYATNYLLQEIIK